jgi:hypothetical protein
MRPQLQGKTRISSLTRVFLGVSVAATITLTGCAGLVGPAASSARTSSGSSSAPVSIATISVAAGTVGAAYSVTLQASGGETPLTWSVTGGSLPPGLTLNSSSGTISGKPTASGTSNFSVQVKDANDSTAAKGLTIKINAAAQPLAIATTSVANTSTNTAYSAFLYAGGGNTPYTWGVLSGSLPAGLALSSSGDITGVATAVGTSTFTVKVTDSSSPSQSATAPFSITVAQGTSYSVSLSWSASSSSGAAGYNVYRSTVNGSDYVKITMSPVSSLSYVDGTVLDGNTYYYVLTTVNSTGDESEYSNQVQMVIP